MSWIWDYWKESLEKGKSRGKELKKEHKEKIKKVFEEKKDE